MTALVQFASCVVPCGWLRPGRSSWVFSPGIASLVRFGQRLPRVDSPTGGRAYAARGGVYIVVSHAWLWAVQGVRPKGADVAGACLSLLGEAMILFGRAGVRMP